MINGRFFCYQTSPPLRSMTRPIDKAHWRGPRALSLRGASLRRASLRRLQAPEGTTSKETHWGFLQTWNDSQIPFLKCKNFKSEWIWPKTKRLWKFDERFLWRANVRCRFLWRANVRCPQRRFRLTLIELNCPNFRANLYAKSLFRIFFGISSKKRLEDNIFFIWIAWSPIASVTGTSVPVAVPVARPKL